MAGVRGPHPLRHASRLQPQGQQHVRQRLARQDHQGVAAGLGQPQLHARGPRKGRQLRRLLPRRRQALPDLGRRRQARQDLGLPEQGVRADARGPLAEHLLRRLSPRAAAGSHRI